MSGNFCYMEFSEFRPVVYIEDKLRGHFLEDASTVQVYQGVAAALSMIAIDSDASIDLIKKLAAALT